jgi:hypothetical protein
VDLTTHVHLVQRLRMSGVALLLPLYAFMVCRGTSLPFTFTFISYVGRLAQSVLRLAMGWTVLGSNPGGGEIFRTRPDRP